MSHIPRVVEVHRMYSTFSRPFLVEADNGELYVLKQAVTADNLRLLAGEYIATKIGIGIGAPVLDCSFIEVAPDSSGLFEGCEGCKQEYIPSAGIYFASHYRHGQPVNQSPEFKSATRPVLNPEGATGSVIFDTWFDNADRHSGNALVVPSENGVKGINIFLIDQGHVFGGPKWASLENPAQIAFRENAGTQFFRATANDLLKHLPMFAPAVDTVTSETVIEHSAIVPDDWGLTDEDRDKIVTFLMERRPLICTRLENHWKGGAP